MKIKKIINLCKKSGQLRIFENEGAQWISDGYAIYPLMGLPLFDEETICAAYDISAKKVEKMHITFDLSLPSNYDFSDDVKNEMQCQRGEALFGALVPITTSHGIEFIQSEYLTPFSDYDDKMLFIYERTSVSGETYFAVKDGLMLVGIIMPYDCINAEFVKRLKDICNQCEISLYNKQTATEREVSE